MVRLPSLHIVTGLLVASCGDSAATGGAPTGGAGHEGAANQGGEAGTGSANGGGGASASGGGGAALGPPPGNVVTLEDGTLSPLYPTGDPAFARALGYQAMGTTLRAHDEHGSSLWEVEVGAGTPFGGFDFDADGVPDAALVRSTESGALCGGQAMVDTSIDVVAGRTGAIYQLTDPMPAICWTFGATQYPTTQWSVLAPLFGSGQTLAVAPYYASEGSFLSFNGEAFDSLGTFVYPSVPLYDPTYTASQPNPYGQGIDHVPNSHVANGMALADGRIAFFTSARSVVYAPGPLGASQLQLDVPWLSGGRTDIAGRNYGIVAQDPGDANLVTLVSGTSAATVYADMQTGTLSSDPWGGIERHVAIVHLDTGTVDDRFFSYAHDGGDAFQYEGRVVFPGQPLVKREGPSRLAFNVYAQGRWHLHVTQPGSTLDALDLLDRFLWDVRDVDGDGVDEWLISPTRDETDPDVPGYYFTKWRTVIARWDDGAASLVELATHEGGIPRLTPFFRSPGVSTSFSFLYPALTERDASGALLLHLIGPSAEASTVVLP